MIRFKKKIEWRYKQCVIGKINTGASSLYIYGLK